MYYQTDHHHRSVNPFSAKSYAAVCASTRDEEDCMYHCPPLHLKAHELPALHHVSLSKHWLQRSNAFCGITLCVYFVDALVSTLWVNFVGSLCSCTYWFHFVGALSDCRPPTV